MQTFYDTLTNLAPDAFNDVVVATVVQVEGSAYRQPAARMVIFADGQSVGMVSGGCLEKHVVQRAFWLTRDGASLQTYHTDAPSDDDLTLADIEHNFGLGCQGTVHILFERLSHANAAPLLDTFAQVMHTRTPQRMATIIRATTTNCVLAIGRHVALADGTDLACGLGLGDGWRLVKRTPASRKSRHSIEHWQQTNTTQAQQFAALVETIEPPPHLVIFGAGQDSAALVQLAKWQGWRVSVVDARADLVKPSRLPLADAVLHLSLDDIEHNAQPVQDLLTAYPKTAVAILTHSLRQDQVWLKHALTAKPLPLYIGQLGPRYRTEQLLTDLAHAYPKLQPIFAQAQQILHAPMGLPIGGDTPEAVALSTVAQIQAALGQLAIPTLV